MYYNDTKITLDVMFLNILFYLPVFNITSEINK